MFINYLAVLCGFQAPPGRLSRKFPVVHSERETPLPIPNRAVKPFSADGTWGATPWESRSPPVLLYSSPIITIGLELFLGLFSAPGDQVLGEKALQAPVVEAGVEVPAFGMADDRNAVIGDPVRQLR